MHDQTKTTEPTRRQPPTLEEMTATVETVRRKILSVDTPTPEQELRLLELEAIAQIADSARGVLAAFAGILERRTANTGEALTAIAAAAADAGAVLDATDLRERSVSDVVAGDPSMGTGRRVGLYAVLDERQYEALSTTLAAIAELCGAQG